jgi:hypothetical protein
VKDETHAFTHSTSETETETETTTMIPSAARQRGILHPNDPCSIQYRLVLSAAAQRGQRTGSKDYALAYPQLAVELDQFLVVMTRTRDDHCVRATRSAISRLVQYCSVLIMGLSLR